MPNQTVRLYQGERGGWGVGGEKERQKEKERHRREIVLSHSTTGSHLIGKKEKKKRVRRIVDRKLLSREHAYGAS